MATPTNSAGGQFAGGRINSTLRYALAFREPTWTFIPDNYAIKIRGGSPTSAWLSEAIAQISTEDFWTTEALHTSITAALPNYRLTKFQPLMPGCVEWEVLSNHLLDVKGTRATLTKPPR